MSKPGDPPPRPEPPATGLVDPRSIQPGPDDPAVEPLPAPDPQDSGEAPPSDDETPPRGLVDPRAEVPGPAEP